MSSEQQTPESTPIRQTPIPSMLTNSMREVLDSFGRNIIELEAEASLDTWNRDELLRDYGMMREQLQRFKASIDYHEIRNEDGIENPLTDTARREILLKLNDTLGDLDSDTAPDLAVSKLRLRVTSEEIREATRAVSDEFELTFVSDPAGDSADLTQQKNLGKGLYDELGFEYRNLNLRNVIEARAKYAEQGDAKLMGWGGPDDVRPRCSEELAQAVYETILPEDFRALKWYRVGQDDVLEMQTLRSDDGEQEVQND
jgi:hypothetical protein